MRYELSEYMLDQLKYEHDEDDILTDYSGRGMYGKTCVGYQGPTPELFAFDLARQLTGEANDGDTAYEWAIAIRDTLEDLGSPSTDSMGLGRIYYWRNVTMGEER
ncbi:hypothetical protein PQD13_gp37 [Gordonia phage Clawz]|uniref:Uncharacterized protein n=1 Tax=Gordonia phage Clawz TaxID=2743910 RepID=A0AAE7F8U8_9CAUD|nr:hypothetical protein PQD13_gp37 [Gordonia phage Clawz]QKY79949.1 hypothetical protein SEA_CLAWZ_37 [Gordonia phage Clawz]